MFAPVSALHWRGPRGAKQSALSAVWKPLPGLICHQVSSVVLPNRWHFQKKKCLSPRQYLTFWLNRKEFLFILSYQENYPWVPIQPHTFAKESLSFSPSRRVLFVLNSPLRRVLISLRHNVERLRTFPSPHLNGKKWRLQQRIHHRACLTQAPLAQESWVYPPEPSATRRKQVEREH